MEPCMACGLFHEYDKCTEQHESSKSAVDSLVSGRLDALAQDAANLVRQRMETELHLMNLRAMDLEKSLNTLREAVTAWAETDGGWHVECHCDRCDALREMIGR